MRGKNFLFLRFEKGEPSFSVKLPRSGIAALALPFVKPTGYGLGRHGWVTCTLTKVPARIVEQCMEWLEESYLAIAPKALAKTMSSAKT